MTGIAAENISITIGARIVMSLIIFIMLFLISKSCTDFDTGGKK
jgi:hypothetical protein